MPDVMTILAHGAFVHFSTSYDRMVNVGSIAQTYMHSIQYEDGIAELGSFLYVCHYRMCDLRTIRTAFRYNTNFLFASALFCTAHYAHSYTHTHISSISLRIFCCYAPCSLSAAVAGYKDSHNHSGLGVYLATTRLNVRLVQCFIVH